MSSVHRPIMERKIALLIICYPLYILDMGAVTRETLLTNLKNAYIHMYIYIGPYDLRVDQVRKLPGIFMF